MNTNKLVLIALALLALAILPQFASAQTYQTWRDPDAATGNWHQANAWWNFPDGSSIVFGQQQWNNNHYTSQTNNNGGSEFSTWQWVFQSGASSAHTFSGDAVRFFDYSTTAPMIQNESGATHIINNNISGDGGEVFSVNINGAGGLTFGGSVNNQGANINVGGTTGSAATVTFQGDVTGSGGMYVNNANLTVLFDGTSSQTGQLTINAGTVRLGGSGDTFGGSSQAIRIGTGATLDLNNVSTTVGSIGEEGSGDGGSVSLGSATLTVGGDSYNTFQNGVTGTGALVKSGSGTLNLYGTVSYSGSTTVNGGVLSSAVAMSTDGVTVSSGTFGTTAADVLGDSVGVTVNGGVYRVGGSDTIGVLSGSGGEVSITNGTLTTSFDGASNNYAGVISGSGGFIKSGSGTLSFNGSSANTASGVLTVSAGEVVFNKSANTAAVGGAVAVSSGATLTTAAANQFGNNAVELDGTLDLDGNNQSLALYNSGTGTVNLGGATLTNNNTGVDTFSGAINGSGNLVKAGNGTLVLTAGSGFTGTTTIGSGAVEIQNANGLGTTGGATTVSDGAALKLYNLSSMTVAESITINGTGVGGIDGSLYNVAGANSVSGTITLGSNSRIGATGGSLSVGAVSGGNNVLFVGGSENTTISGVLSGSGNSQDGTTTSLFKDGAGVLTLSGNNTYAGDTRITAGAVTVGSGGNLGNGSSDVFLSSGAVLNVNADTEIASLRETGTGNGGTASIGAGANLTVSGNAYDAFMNSISGSGNLVKSGTGTMALYGTQSYSGTTTVSGGKITTGVALSSSGVTVSGGTFEATAADVLGNGTTVAVNSGTYSVGGSDTIGKLTGSGGTVDITNGTLTTSFNGTSESYSGAITGAGGFAKAGTGTLTLTGNNTKSGANTVSAGLLVVDGQLAGTTTVSSSGTLAGSGSVGATTIASGGTISPGNSPGTLSLTNTFTLSGGGNYNWQIYNTDDSLTAGQSTTWDLIDVSADLDISGLSSGSKFNINLWSLSGVSPDVNGLAINWDNTQNQLWEIMTFTSLTGTFSEDLFNINTSAINGTAGFANDLNGGVFSLAVDGDSLNLLFTASNPTPSPVPEPGTWAAGALLAGAAGYMRWRRRKQDETKA